MAVCTGSRTSTRTPALLVAFISNRCPFVLLIREELARLGRDYADQGLRDRRDQRERRGGASRGDARPDRRRRSRARLRLPLPQGRGPVGRQGLRRRLHAGPLPLRRRPASRLSRPVRRRAAGQRQAGDRRRPARRRSTPCWPASAGATPRCRRSAATSSGWKATSRRGSASRPEAAGRAGRVPPFHFIERDRGVADMAALRRERCPPGRTAATDVLVIGGGPAAAWAAIAAAEAGARVMLVDKGYHGTSGATAPSNTGTWCVPPGEHRAQAVARRWERTDGPRRPALDAAPRRPLLREPASGWSSGAIRSRPRRAGCSTPPTCAAPTTCASCAPGCFAPGSRSSTTIRRPSCSPTARPSPAPPGWCAPPARDWRIERRRHRARDRRLRLLRAHPRRHRADRRRAV